MALPDEPTWTAGTTWMDKQPWKALRVRTQTDEVQLNPANIIGNGIDAAVNGSAAFVALRNERSGGARYRRLGQYCLQGSYSADIADPRRHR
ncbi:hypothetical protein NWF32_30335 [Pseudomonas qingdaonensis]|nr:hypothetical protein [Pseudomonas qingdaonensis]